ncbi:hypothetical protein ACFSKM_22175 [Ancylobacter dichloromethanicus]
MPPFSATADGTPADRRLAEALRQEHGLDACVGGVPAAVTPRGAGVNATPINAHASCAPVGARLEHFSSEEGSGAREEIRKKTNI